MPSPGPADSALDLGSIVRRAFPEIPLAAHSPRCANRFNSSSRAPSEVRLPLSRTVYHAPNVSAQGLPQRKRVLSICALRFAVCVFFRRARSTTRQTRPLKEFPSSIASSAFAFCGLRFLPPRTVHHAPNVSAHGNPWRPAFFTPSLRLFVTSSLLPRARSTTRRTRPLKEFPSAIASSAFALCVLRFAFSSSAHGPPRAKRVRSRSSPAQSRPQHLRFAVCVFFRRARSTTRQTCPLMEIPGVPPSSLRLSVTSSLLPRAVSTDNPRESLRVSRIPRRRCTHHRDHRDHRDHRESRTQRCSRMRHTDSAESFQRQLRQHCQFEADSSRSFVPCIVSYFLSLCPLCTLW